VGHVVQGIIKATQRLNYNIVLHIQNVSAHSDEYYRSMITSGLTDGMLMVVPQDYEALLTVCRDYEMPYVMVDYQGDIDLIREPIISATDRKGVMDAMRHLMALGHKRIAFITGLMHMRSARERLQGYQDALNEIGIRFDPALVVEGDWSQQTGFALTQHLLGLKIPPTAIVASNDVTAFGVMDAIKEAGMRVGEDISVVGFDDIGMASNVYPALTTVRQPMEEMGEASVELLVALMEDRPLPMIQRQFSTELVVRQSTAQVKSR
jgi:LacI family transcriptional regulator